jgi:hypothetical protein
MRILVNVVAGLAVLAASFSIALQAIDGWPIFQQSDYEIAQKEADVRKSELIAGNVDNVERDAEGRLVFSGWAVDLEHPGPLTISVLLGPTFERVATTNGPRDDVTKALRLPEEQAKNVAFSGSTERVVDCGPESRFTVVAINQRRQHAVIATNVRAPPCGTATASPGSTR